MPVSRPVIRIGSRKSKLALAQAAIVRAALAQAWPELAAPGRLEIVEITTSGDRITDRPLADIGGKGLFVKELEEHLLANTIDIAVHSMKDTETTLADSLIIDCILPREDCREVWISAAGHSMDSFPQDGVIGTSSVRRAAQMLRLHPTCRIIPFRGNVTTRLGKLHAGQVDATLLALAGLKRLGLEAQATEILGIDTLLPAAGQGAIGIERRQADEDIAAMLAPLNHPPSLLRLTAERAMLATLDGSCRTPIAGYAAISGNTLDFHGMILSPDGRQWHECRESAGAGDAAALGQDCGGRLRAEAGEAFFADWGGNA